MFKCQFLPVCTQINTQFINFKDSLQRNHEKLAFRFCSYLFLGVLFALKVLSNHYHPGGVTYVMGLPISNRYASWVELVLIHLTAPG